MGRARTRSSARRRCAITRRACAAPSIRASTPIAPSSLCAGLGGGTGSAVAELARALSPTGLPIAALVTVPASHEAGLSKVNAVRAIDALIAEDVDSLLVVDNQRVLEAYAAARLDRYLHAGNDAIVRAIHVINTMHSSASAVVGRGFDRSDLQRAFLAGGFTRTAVVELPEALLADGEKPAHAIASGLTDGRLFAPGADLTQARFVAALVAAPRDVLARISPCFVRDLQSTLKNLTAGAAAYAGAFQVPDGEPARAYAVVGGLGYPESLSRLLAEAVSEGQQLERKVEGALGALDTSGLDDLDRAAHLRWRAKHMGGEARVAPARADAQTPATSPRTSAAESAPVVGKPSRKPRGARDAGPPSSPPPALRPSAPPPSAPGDEADGRTVPSAPIAALALAAPRRRGACARSWRSGPISSTCTRSSSSRSPASCGGGGERAM
ncbi:MAG: hypothetical protein M5U28_42305 [Sandaracinaceae bacterium]|nr:hypothetical protein [Sandaracinaceae bacterium]